MRAPIIIQRTLSCAKFYWSLGNAQIAMLEFRPHEGASGQATYLIRESNGLIPMQQIAQNTTFKVSTLTTGLTK